MRPAVLKRIVMFSLAMLAMTEGARTQDYPTRPVKLVVPFIAG